MTLPKITEWSARLAYKAELAKIIHKAYEDGMYTNDPTQYAAMYDKWVEAHRIEQELYNQIF